MNVLAHFRFVAGAEHLLPISALASQRWFAIEFGFARLSDRSSERMRRRLRAGLACSSLTQWREA